MNGDDIVALIGLETTDPKAVSTLRAFGWDEPIPTSGGIYDLEEVHRFSVEIRDGRFFAVDFLFRFAHGYPFGLTAEIKKEDIAFPLIREAMPNEDRPNDYKATYDVNGLDVEVYMAPDGFAVSVWVRED